MTWYGSGGPMKTLQTVPLPEPRPAFLEAMYWIWCDENVTGILHGPGFSFYDADGARTYGLHYRIESVNPVGTAFHELHSVCSVPEDAVTWWIAENVFMHSGYHIYATKFRVCEADYDLVTDTWVPAEYFDGDSDGWEWDGTPHNSVSRFVL